MKKSWTDVFWTIGGLLLVGAGFVLLKVLAAPEGFLQALPYVLIGVGCGLFGQGCGGLLNRRALKNSPELARQQEINAKDERNVAIGEKAKARAFDRMVFVFGALLLCFALMGVEMVAVLLLVAAYLFVVGYALYCRLQYEKEM